MCQRSFPFACVLSRNDGQQRLQIYSTEVDDDTYARSVKDPEDVLSHIAHETNDWAYGQCQKIKVRMELRVPGVACQAKAEADDDGDGRQPAKSLWAYEGSNLVCTAVGASIYGFNFRSGKRILNWENLHNQYISQFLFLPDRGQAITVCEAPTAILWKLEGWCVSVLCCDECGVFECFNAPQLSGA